MSPEVGEELTVYLHDMQIGVVERRGPKRYRFRYNDEVRSRHETGAIVLSVSLPVREDEFPPAAARPFFDGLLPEGVVRSSLAHSLKASEEDGFALLKALGADCAGAVAVLPKGESPQTGEGEIRPLSRTDLARLIEELPEHPLGIDGRATGIRLSLGGIQEKLVLVRSPNGEYGQPLDGAPSTCILKPEHERYPEIVANEAFGLRLAGSAGLDAARAEPTDIDGRPCLHVERFDRTIVGGGRIARVHQEDMCQALGIVPVDKYEASGGPSIAAIVQLLRDTGSPRAAVDILKVIEAALLNFLIGNSDAHGKNLALLYDPTGGVRLAPLYDLVSTQVYEGSEPALAMRIGSVEDPERVEMDAWRELGKTAGIGAQLPALIAEQTERILRCADALVATGKAEGWHRPVVDRIFALMQERARQLGHRARSS
ncbi:MAG TPA: type II toxin-antitoxin system HipA family toxin [Acidimicrobiia bacterium]|nr:type II toxin-antitoxin system HipA family toxin [Acidimicrobiia bacterium]